MRKGSKFVWRTTYCRRTKWRGFPVKAETYPAVFYWPLFTSRKTMQAQCPKGWCVDECTLEIRDCSPWEKAHAQQSH